MITETKGNLLEAKAEALVNAVNQRRRDGQRNRVAVSAGVFRRLFQRLQKHLSKR